MKFERTQCFVYRLRSERRTELTYIGLTSDLHKRLREHNEGLSKHTARHRPWYVEIAVWFRDPAKAVAFESYLKSGSGRAFAERHL